MEHARFPVRRQRKQPLKTSCFACPDESRAADAVAAARTYATPQRATLSAASRVPPSSHACLRLSLPHAARRANAARQVGMVRETEACARCHCRCTQLKTQTTSRADPLISSYGAMNLPSTRAAPNKAAVEAKSQPRWATSRRCKYHVPSFNHRPNVGTAAQKASMSLPLLR